MAAIGRHGSISRIDNADASYASFLMRLLAILVSSVWCLSHPDRNDTIMLLSVPVTRSSWEPRYTVKTAYAQIHRNNTRSYLMKANMSLNTTRPTVRLDNYRQISSISCASDSEMLLQFDSPANAKLAFKAWSHVQDLVFLFGHEHGCNDDESGHALIDSLTLNKNKINVMLELVDFDEVVNDWTLSVSQVPITTKANNTLTKRDIHDDLVIPLTFNYDNTLKTIGDPFFWFLGCQFIYCDNCYTLGQAKYEIDIVGKGLIVDKYKLRFKGDFKANIDLKLAALPREEAYLYWDYLQIVELGYLKVPGLFALGPAFRIMSAIVLLSDTEVSAVLGFDINFPFDIEIASDDLKTPVEIKSKRHAHVNFHPIKVIAFDPKPTYIGGQVMLAPEIALGLHLYGRTATGRPRPPMFDFAARIPTWVGFVNKFGNLTNCANETSSTTIFRRHKVEHTVAPTPLMSLIYHDWDTGRIPVACAGCNSCKADQPGNKQGNKMSDKFDNMLEAALNVFSNVTQQKPDEHPPGRIMV